MTWIAVAYAKYSVFLVKAVLVVAAFVSSPRLSAQAGHGTPDAHGTPAASHGSSDAHAKPADSHAADSHAKPADSHAGDAHAKPAADSHGDAHAKPAAESHGDAHAKPVDSHAAGHGDDHAGTAAGHGDSHAADAAHHDAPLWGPTMWGLPLGVWHAINFVILFGAIFWVTRRALVVAVRNKRDATAKSIVEATALRDEMKKKFEEYDVRMRTIDERMAAIVTEAKTESEAEMAKMVTEAGVVGNRIREDAKLIADQEIARAKRELQDEQIARAAELAEQILRSSITKEDQARLADEFMSRVGKEGRT